MPQNASWRSAPSDCSSAHRKRRLRRCRLHHLHRYIGAQRHAQDARRRRTRYRHRAVWPRLRCPRRGQHQGNQTRRRHLFVHPRPGAQRSRASSPQWDLIATNPNVEIAFTVQSPSQTGPRNVKVELYGFSTIRYNCRSKPKSQVQLDPLKPLRFKLRSKAVVEYLRNNNLRLIAEGLDAAFESSHRSAHRVEAGSYHHERRARRCVDGHADALPRRGVCRLAGNAGSACRRPAEDRSRHERLQRCPHQARRSAEAD